jgi:hypothetical protein
MTVSSSRRRGRPAVAPARLDDFFRLLAESGSVARAAERAGVQRSTLYLLRKADPALARRWNEALQIGLDRLQDHAVDRATVGIETPVWKGGQQVGSVARPDNRLLQFLLKAHRPEIYDRSNARAAASSPLDLARRLAAAEKRLAAKKKEGAR